MTRAAAARPSRRRVTSVGVISDTHGLLRPEALIALAGSDLVIHAGDVGSPEVLEGLRRALGEVVAVRGNNDTAPWARALPERAVVEVAGARILVIHDVKELGRAPHRAVAEEETIAGAAGVAGVAGVARVAVVIAGHSHRPRCVLEGGVLWLNPGSAGPRRFRLPVAVARLHVEPPRAGEVEPRVRGEILPLEV